MNAYGSQSEMGLPNSEGKGRYGSPSLQIQKEHTRGSRDHKMQPSQNIYLIPIAVGETLIMLGVIAMNYCFRFDPAARDTSSLADYENLFLQPSDLIPYRPFYNYSLSHDENQNSTIPGSTLVASFGITFGMPEYAFFVTAFVFPFLVLLSVELGKHFLCTGKPRKTVDSLGIMFPTPARRILRFLYVYLMFGSMAGMLTAFIKLLIPLPRPHFLAVCLQDANPGVRAIFVAECVNPNKGEVWEALRSFPSYHATIAVYGGAFVCLYLYYTMKFHGYYSVNVMLSLPVFVMAAIGVLHRWATYHNTFMDIVWGGVVGLFLALYAVYGMLNRFKDRASAILPVTAIPASTTPAPEPFTLNTPITLQPQIHHNPAFVDDEPIGNHFVRRGVPMTKGPVSRPTQAFNSSFGLDSDYRQQPDAQDRMVNYNNPRQRFSVAPPPDREPPSMARPASAYPAPRAHHPPPPPRPRSRYEGASYF